MSPASVTLQMAVYTLTWSSLFLSLASDSLFLIFPSFSPLLVFNCNCEVTLGVSYCISGRIVYSWKAWQCVQNCALLGFLRESAHSSRWCALQRRIQLMGREFFPVQFFPQTPVAKFVPLPLLVLRSPDLWYLTIASIGLLIPSSSLDYWCLLGSVANLRSDQILASLKYSLTLVAH